VRDLEALGGLRRIDGRIDGAGVTRPLDVDAVATVDQEVEVELARSPSRAPPTTGLSLKGLETAEQCEGGGLGIRGVGGDVQRNDRVPELGLVGDAPRRGRIQPRHAADRHAWQCVECRHRVAERPGCIPEVRAEPDIRADGPAAAHPGHLTIRA
jgi:hypothetical protein